MVEKQLRTYCSKCNRGNIFWGWHKEKNHDENCVPKPPFNARKHEYSGTPQLQLDNDMKKSLNTLTGGMVDATDLYEPDF